MAGRTTVAWLLTACFAIFSSRPARADVILTASDGVAQDASVSASAVAPDIALQPGSPAELPASGAEASGEYRVGSIEIMAMAALGLLVVAGYFFGATAHPTPGW